MDDINWTYDGNMDEYSFSDKVPVGIYEGDLEIDFFGNVIKL